MPAELELIALGVSLFVALLAFALCYVVEAVKGEIIMGQDLRIKAGSVVQVNEKGGDWTGCVLIVDELKSFGVQAYLHVPYKGDAYIRLPWDAIEYIGEAVLTVGGE